MEGGQCYKFEICRMQACQKKNVTLGGSGILGGSVLCFYGMELRQNLSDVFLVGHFHVVLVHDGVLHGGVNLRVAQNFGSSRIFVG